MRLAILVMAILCALNASADATTIVAIWTKSLMILAADSKGKNEFRTDVPPRCKIKSANNVFWAQQGISSDDGGYFVLSDIVATAMSGSGDLDQRIAEFKRLVIPKLTVLLNVAKKRSPDFYEKNVQNGDAVEVTFAAFESGAPKMRIITLRPREDASGVVSIDAHAAGCPEKDCGEFTYIFSGANQRITEIVHKDPSIWDRLGPEGAARSLIEDEIAAVPADVGPPIAMVEVTKDGARWLSKGECAPDQK